MFVCQALPVNQSTRDHSRSVPSCDIDQYVNTKYTHQQMLQLLPVLEECGVFCVEEPFDVPGLGVKVDETLFETYPGIPGPCYV